MCMCRDDTTATVCFKRKSNICIAKFGNLGVNGVKGSKFLVGNVIFGIADPDLPIHYVAPRLPVAPASMGSSSVFLPGG